MYDELLKRLHQRIERIALTRAGSPLQDDLREAADAIEELIAKLNHADAQIDRLVEAAEERRWIPVTERLPRMWEEVMLQFPNNQAVGFHDGDSGWAVFTGDNLYTYVTPEEVHPTHWKPKEERAWEFTLTA